MARQVLPWVGAAIGAMWGMPQLGFAIGSLVGNAVDPMVLKAPSIGDGQTQSSQEGVPINRVYGTACVGGNIIARGDLKKITKRSSQGKGGPVQEEERFLLTYAIGITHHEIGGILRIWEDEKLVYDVRPEGSQVSSEENVKYAEKFRLFLGTNDQNPSSDLEMIFGAGDTPAYRNRSYIVFPENDVTDRRGSIPVYRFEVTTSDVVYSPGLFIQDEGFRQFSGVPGTYQLLGSSSGTGNALTQLNSCSTADGMYVVDASYHDKITVYKRDDTITDWVLHQQLAWDFTSNNGRSTRCKVRFSKSGRWLLVYYRQASSVGETEYRLVSLPFDIETGLIDPNPNDELICNQAYFSAPSALTGNSKSFSGDLVFDSSGSYFTLSFGWGSSNVSVAVIGFDDNLGEFTTVNSKAKACNNKLPSSSYQNFIFGGTEFLIAKPKIQNSTSVVYAYKTHGSGFDCVNPDHPNNHWGVSSSLSIPANGYLSSFGIGSMLDSDMAFTSYHQGNNQLFFPLITNTYPGKSFPWSYFNFITGQFGGLNYGLIPMNERPDTGADKVVHSIAVSGGGQYIASYTNPTSSPQNSDVILAVYSRNPITEGYELVQELTRQQILDSGTTPYNNSGPTVLTFSGSQFFATATGKYYLPNIIKDVADLCEPGLDQKLDVSELEGKVVDGFVIGSQVSARSVISSLQQTHFFDPTEYDEKVNFIVRGKAVSEVITEQDLVDEDPWSQLRKSSIEYPKTLNLKYQNATSGYDVALARTVRSSSSVQVSGEKTIEVPEVMDTDRAARVSDIQMKIAWAEAAGNFTFTVPASWHDTWVPSDVLGLYLGDTPYRLRIEKIERADGELKIEASMDRQSAYSSFVTGIPVREPTPPAPTIAGEMKHVYLNMPALIDSNDVLGYYLGTSGTRPAYTGGVVERKHDGIAEDYSSVLSVGSGRTLAFLLAPITASSEHYVDTTNVLHVKVYGEDFEAFQTASNDLFLREENGLALVNAAGEVELVQYRDVEVVAEGEYKLTHLLRGRLNTTPRAFAMNDTVAVLDDVRLVVVDGSEIGTTFNHRSTAYGENPLESAVSTDSFAQPLMQTEFPVDLLEVSMAGDVATVSWSPRERFGSDLNPIRSVNWESYRITYDDGTLEETFNSLTPTHTHDLAAYSGTVVITVQQVNRLTGPGPAKTVSVVV